MSCTLNPPIEWRDEITPVNPRSVCVECILRIGVHVMCVDVSLWFDSELHWDVITQHGECRIMETWTPFNLFRFLALECCVVHDCLENFVAIHDDASSNFERMDARCSRWDGDGEVEIVETRSVMSVSVSS